MTRGVVTSMDGGTLYLLASNCSDRRLVGCRDYSNSGGRPPNERYLSFVLTYSYRG